MWYTNATTGSKDPVFYELYYDETLDVIMSSCAVPKYDKDNNFIGVVTVDIKITSITNKINEIKVGEDGTAIYDKCSFPVIRLTEKRYNTDLLVLYLFLYSINTISH